MITIALTDEDGSEKKFDLNVVVTGEAITETKEVVEENTAATNETESTEVEEEDAEEEEEEEEEEEGPRKTTSIGVWRPKWEKKASAEAVASLMGKRKVQPPPTETYVPPPKPKMNIDKISRDGKIEVAFNQDMWVPKFRKPAKNKTKKRRLKTSLLLSEFDVTRDIIDLDFSLQSEVKASNIKFTLTIVKWTPRKFHLFINFTDPLQISRGLNRDLVTLKVKNPRWFRSAASDEPIDLGVVGSLVKTLPRQLPKGISEKVLVREAKTVSDSLESLMIIQLVLQVALKGSINDIWGLFLIL